MEVIFCRQEFHRAVLFFQGFSWTFFHFQVFFRLYHCKNHVNSRIYRMHNSPELGQLYTYSTDQVSSSNWYHYQSQYVSSRYVPTTILKRLKVLHPILRYLFQKLGHYDHPHPTPPLPLWIMKHDHCPKSFSSCIFTLFVLQGWDGGSRGGDQTQ